jgi:hypothetical protein
MPMCREEEAALGQDRLNPRRTVRPVLQLLDQCLDILQKRIVPTEMVVELQREDLGVGQDIAVTLIHGN